MNVKITELPLADALTGAEAIPIVQDGITKQTTTGDLLPPYKVFTGLLTQSGGDDPQTISDGLVTKGVTYQIQGDDGNFLNVGAPNNNDGTYFIAINNEQPTDYGTSLLNYNTGAPTVTILENTLGNVWFEYFGVGSYFARIPIVSEQKQVVFSCGQSFKTVSNENYLQIANNSIDGEIYFQTTNGLTTIDGYINDLPIEIRVYN